MEMWGKLDMEDLEANGGSPPSTAFRDRNAGRNNNRSKPTDEAEQPSRPRGNRGPRGDRQSRTGQT